MKKINKSYKNNLVCGMMYLVIRMKVKIAISARHVHLTRDDYNYLFDKRFIINYKNLLSKKYSYTNI